MKFMENNIPPFLESFQPRWVRYKILIYLNRNLVSFFENHGPMKWNVSSPHLRKPEKKRFFDLLSRSFAVALFGGIFIVLDCSQDFLFVSFNPRHTASVNSKLNGNFRLSSAFVNFGQNRKFLAEVKLNLSFSTAAAHG